MNIRSIRILMLFALTMVVVAACNQKTTDPTTTQLGSLQGRVTEGTPATASASAAAATTAAASAPSRQAQAQLPDVKFGEGLPNVRVTVFLKGQLKTTKTSPDNPKTTDVDEGGYFTIPGLPAGVQLPVTFDRQNYVKLNGNVEIPAVAGSGDSAIALKDPVASIEVAMVKGEGSASLNLDRLIKKFKGLLQGIVVDGTPGADRGKALGDVTISLFVGGTVITTTSKTNDEKTAFDETGFFSIGNLPPGQPLSATFEKAEYQKTRITVTVPVAQGTEEPAVNVEVKLVKGDITKIIEDTVKPLPFNGTIQGIIRDGTVAADTFGKPMSGVTVAALVLGKVVETTSKEDDPLTPGFDETGFFALNNLPIGLEIPVRFKKEGYVSLTSLVSLSNPGLSNDVEQETSQVTLDIDLVKDTATLTVIVYAGKGLANGATVVLDLTSVPTPTAAVTTVSNSTGTSLSSGFEVYQVKTTDANGQAKFEKLPPIVIPQNAIIVQAFDENSDSIPDYYTATNNGTPGAIDLRNIGIANTGPSIARFNLRANQSITPTVIWSNVVTNAVLNTSDVLKFVFDLDMDTMPVAEVKEGSTIKTPADPKNGMFAVTLTDYDSNPVPFKATWKDKNTLEVDPISDLQPTHKVNFDPTSACASNCYTVSVIARSLQGVATAAYSKSFKVTEKAAALTSTAVGLWPSPDGTGLDWNTISTSSPTFTLSWGQDANATGYNIYAKDNGLNKDWVRVSSGVTFPTTAAQVGTTHSPTIVYTPSPPTQFDRCQTNVVCSGVEPLAFGGQITFGVTTLNRDGIESALDDTKAATAKDTKAPSLAAIAMGGQTCPKTGSAAMSGAQQVLAPGTQSGVSAGTTADNETAAGCPFATTASCSAAKTIRVLVTTFPEPMSGGGGSPSVINTTTAGTGDCAGGTVTSNSADPTVVGSGWADNTAVGPGLRQYYVDISVPAGKNSKGDCIAFNFAGAADAGGNAVIQTAPASKPDTAIVEGRCKGEGTVIVYKLE